VPYNVACYLNVAVVSLSATTLVLLFFDQQQHW